MPEKISGIPGIHRISRRIPKSLRPLPLSLLPERFNRCQATVLLLRCAAHCMRRLSRRLCVRAVLDLSDYGSLRLRWPPQLTGAPALSCSNGLEFNMRAARRQPLPGSAGRVYSFRVLLLRLPSRCHFAGSALTSCCSRSWCASSCACRWPPGKWMAKHPPSTCSIVYRQPPMSMWPPRPSCTTWRPGRTDTAFRDVSGAPCGRSPAARQDRRRRSQAPRRRRGARPVLLRVARKTTPSA